MIVSVLMDIIRILWEFVKLVIYHVKHVYIFQQIAYHVQIILIELFQVHLVSVIIHIMIMDHLFVQLVHTLAKIVQLDQYVNRVHLFQIDP